MLKQNGITITTEEDYEDRLKRSLRELKEQERADKTLNVKREVKKELTKLKNKNKKESKKCIMCKEKGIYHIKDSLDYYCKDCAIEFFGSLDCLKK